MSQPRQEGGKREKHREKGSTGEQDHRLRMQQTISATSSNCMLVVACASPRTALLSPSSRSPLPMPLSLLGHCSLLTQKKGMVVSNMLESETA